jgi:hypothetical protein
MEGMLSLVAFLTPLSNLLCLFTPLVFSIAAIVFVHSLAGLGVRKTIHEVPAGGGQAQA